MPTLMPARHAESSASRTTASHQQPPRATTTADSVLPAELGLGEVQHELGLEVLWWLDDFGGFARGRGGGHGIGDGGERPQRPRRGEERGKGDGTLRCGPLWAGHVSRICEGGRDGGTRRDDGGHGGVLWYGALSEGVLVVCGQEWDEAGAVGC